MDNQSFRENLIKELGIANLPTEAQDEIVAKVGEMVLQSLTATILNRLNPAAREQFNRISESGDPAQIQQFLEENAPGIQDMMSLELKKTLEEFKKSKI